MTKIAIIGTHGVGKTTLAHKMAYEKMQEGKSVIVLGETARECPFPLNKQMSVEAALWIFHRQMIKELEAEQRYDVVICDRSTMDSFIYAQTMDIDKQEDSRLFYPMYAAIDHMSTYDDIFFVKKGNFQPKIDGFRDTDRAFQEQIEELFKNSLDSYAKCGPFKSLFVCDIRNFEVFKSIKKIDSDSIFANK